MPARVCEFWARARREGRDPFEGYDLRDAWRNETTYDDVWRNFFPRGTDPWGASVTGEPWAQRGEKTRLALAMLVVSAANVLLLDEPTNNLDPASRAEVLSAIRTYAGAVVLVTHDPGAVEALQPDRVLVLPDGVEDLWSDDYAELVDLA